MDLKQVDNPRGTEIELDGQTLVFAPLTLGALEKLAPKLESFDLNDFGLVVDMAHKSLKRNYPDVTREQVGDMICVDEMVDVMQAILNVSGMKKTNGEAEGN